MNKTQRVHFLTAYTEYLWEQGIKTEEAYVGDASRFLRFLADRATAADVAQFLRGDGYSTHYARRLRNTLRKFYEFAAERLDIHNNPLA
ncbi:MAG: site-specific integrase [Limnochordia bacterium]